jgi:hypothetical protein
MSLTAVGTVWIDRGCARVQSAIKWIKVVTFRDPEMLSGMIG